MKNLSGEVEGTFCGISTVGSGNMSALSFYPITL